VFARGTFVSTAQQQNPPKNTEKTHADVRNH